MNQTSNGFRTQQEMGLFTFYKMQEQKQQTQPTNAPIVNPEIKNNKLALFPKKSVVNPIKESVVKRRVQSVAECQKDISQQGQTKILRYNLKLNKKKLSEVVSQQKHSIVDFSFDLSPYRRKNAGIQLFQMSSQRIKTTNTIQEQRKQWDLYNSRYFHSVHLMKIKQIKKEQMKELFKSYRQSPQKQMKQIKLKMRLGMEVQKYIVDSVQQNSAQLYTESPKLKQSCARNKITKQKQQPLNFLQYLQKKKKKMTQEYKKVRLNKKIGDILNLKLNDNYPFRLKRIGFERSEVGYMVPSSRYPVYQ